MESINVVHLTVERLSHNRQRPRLEKFIVLRLPLDDGVSDNAHAVCVSNYNGTFKESGFFHPSRSSHLSVAIESKPSGEDRVFGLLAARQDSCDAGSDRS